MFSVYDNLSLLLSGVQVGKFDIVEWIVWYNFVSVGSREAEQRYIL